MTLLVLVDRRSGLVFNMTAVWVEWFDYWLKGNSQWRGWETEGLGILDGEKQMV